MIPTRTHTNSYTRVKKRSYFRTREKARPDGGEREMEFGVLTDHKLNI